MYSNQHNILQYISVTTLINLTCNTKSEFNIFLFQFVMKSNFLVCQNYVRDDATVIAATLFVFFLTQHIYLSTCVH